MDTEFRVPSPGPLPPNFVRLVLASLPCAAVAAMTCIDGSSPSKGKPLKNCVRTLETAAQWEWAVRTWPDELRCEATSTHLAGAGMLDALKAVQCDGCPWDSDACSAAARGGHLEVLKWARGEGCPWDEWTCSNAAYGGHLDVLVWATEHGCPMWIQ